MPTFKTVVLKHQKRNDGKFPVSIRITHNRKSVYISTGLYASSSQINRKSFEVKDQFILTRTGQTILDFEKRLLQFSTQDLHNMSVKDLKSALAFSNDRLDYLAFCRELIENDKDKWGALRSALNVLDEMGINNMLVTDFTSQFIFRFKEFLDKKTIPIWKNGKVIGEKHYKVRTKNSYLIELCKVFRLMQRKYNSEYNLVIAHNPFIGFEYYKDEVTQKRALSVDELRAFFAISPIHKATQLAQDVMKLSFCLCGMNLVDLLSLRSADFDEKNMRIGYFRSKTKGRRADNAFSSIHIEPEIADLFAKYRAKSGDLLFDFGMDTSRGSARNIGMSLDRLCKEGGFKHVSSYWFRHSWATIARNDCDVSKDDIDLCLNHVGQNKMADVYIKPDWSRIDRANRKVLDKIF